IAETDEAARAALERANRIYGGGMGGGVGGDGLWGGPPGGVGRVKRPPGPGRSLLLVGVFWGRDPRARRAVWGAGAPGVSRLTVEPASSGRSRARTSRAPIVSKATLRGI